MTSKRFLFELNKVMALPLVVLVRVYRVALSPDHSWLRHRHPYGYCRFYPSCSTYTLTGLQQSGLMALPKIVFRVARCHPWSAGGFDPYPSKTTHTWTS